MEAQIARVRGVDRIDRVGEVSVESPGLAAGEQRDAGLVIEREAASELLHAQRRRPQLVQSVDGAGQVDGRRVDREEARPPEVRCRVAVHGENEMVGRVLRVRPYLEVRGRGEASADADLAVLVGVEQDPGVVRGEDAARPQLRQPER